MKYTFPILLLLIVALIGCGPIEKKVCIPDAVDNVFVYDISDVLSEQQENNLNQRLRAIKNTSSNPIVVIFHNDFCGDEPYHYATTAGQNMGVGTDSLDNGVVIAVATQTHKTFIAIGDGLEGAIPDIYANRIVEEEMIPSFKKQSASNYYEGVQSGIGVLEKLAAGEYNFKQTGNSSNSRKDKQVPVAAIWVLLFFVLVPMIRFFRRVHQYADINEIAFWTAFSLLMQSGRTHGGSWDDFRGGGGHFGGGYGGGGSSGGGFGGFGGGSFGGGGAGGSW